MPANPHIVQLSMRLRTEDGAAVTYGDALAHVRQFRRPDESDDDAAVRLLELIAQTDRDGRA
ncbi:hypothetical protein ACQP2U_42620 (plasmid) [Nocardia sp. CA-084685]|uniref:hypothetical protein n=1 Tax=Nocardia sp. CA-084685 TaxID=3239970 RepID=UPI003D957DE8